MTDYKRRYSIPTDAVTRKTHDKLADKLVVHSEHEQRKRTALADKVRSLEARLAAVEAWIARI